MKTKAVLIGAGGHARSVMDIALENEEYDFLGCLSNSNEEEVLGIPIIGGDDLLPGLVCEGVKHFFVAIGDNKIRNTIFDRCLSLGMIPINIISKTATISKFTKVGKGVCILHHTVVHVNTKIGDNCIVNTGATIDHDCSVGKSAHISVGSHMCGFTQIGEGTLIAPGVTVRDRIKIGRWCIVGLGAAVVKDIEDHTISFGVPARIIKKN